MGLNKIYLDFNMIGSKKFVRKCNKKCQNVSVMKRPTHFRILRKRVDKSCLRHVRRRIGLFSVNMSDDVCFCVKLRFNIPEIIVSPRNTRTLKM